MATSATKIVLKETTKMTLHERFSLYRQNTQLGIGVNPATSRQAMLMNHQASVKNQRLAVQMANRPSVVAALKLKKSLKQRLGQNQGGYLMSPRFQQSNIKSRLSLGFRQRFNGGMNARNLMNPGIIRPGTSPMIKARLGMSQNHAIMFAGSRGGFSQPRLRRNFRKGRNRNAVRHQIIQQSLSHNRGILFSNRINKASFRAKQQRGRGRGRGGGAGRNRMGRDAKVPTKQDLDNDLDQYMSQVKSNLDAELESYMSQATAMT